MATLVQHHLAEDTEVIGSRIGRIDPDNFRNQSGASIEDDDDTSDETEDNGLFDEPVDEDGDPTGEHDHHQDDNYALGGHVTRSGSV
ncbi:hypothetical protein ACFSUS_13825 [Spirosoma soli]|uniref:Uncharacterized protein n=1 Tax=Spirosoma soli TaxID=1770529 RepID=A0ABW5M4X0_9BACT